ncbi:MAG: TonB-dependent receptor [Bacteroidales bacterium]|nr:TonB-dependent receptor [Bacteroidales bacterium]
MKGFVIKLCALLFILTVLSPELLHAQNTVTGKVTDSSNGEPLTGVNIAIKGTMEGTVTNLEGEFSLKVDDPNAELVFSYVGYLTETYSLGGSSHVELAMVQDLLSLEELVVIGYGSARKSDLTGSVAVINTENLDKIQANDVSKLLQGQAAGVSVTGSGEPGAVAKVKIRGIGSLGNTEPLYVVDGVPLANATNVDVGHFEGQFPLGVPSGGISDLNPNDIESVQILKDASAAAIYGSRGANGVIIITTKRGQAGGMKVTYDGSFGIQNITHRMDVCNRVQFQEMNNVARENARERIAPANNPDTSLFIDDVDTDWQEEVFTTGHITDHNLSLQGGNENSSYYASLNYFDQTGTMVGPGPRYTRYSATLNLDQSKGRFKFGQSFFYSYSNQIRLTNSQWANPIYETISALPTVSVYDENNIGGYGGGIDEIHDQIAGNQVAFNNLKNNYLKRYRFKGVLYGDVEIISGLNYKINLSYDRSDWLNHEFYPVFEIGSRHVNTIAFLNEWRGENPYMLMEQTLTYNKSFAGNDITAMIGHSAQHDYQQQNYSHSEGFTEPYLEVIGAGPDNQTALGDLFEHRMLSYFGRLVYTYKDRYLATINLRRDYSSRFGSNNKYGNFPSFSAAWKIHNESFFNVNFISMLKIRGGWGKIGSDAIGDYLYESYINNAVTYPFNGELPAAGIQSNIIDPSIKWEERITSNGGIDMAFFANKLEITVEYYHNEANDILYAVPVPWSTGTVLNPTVNSASMTNEGFEFVVGYRKYEGEFHWNISANLTTLKNEVTKLGKDDEPVLRYMSRTAVGHSMGELYGWDMIGIFQTEEEIDAHATQQNAQPGDIKFRDVNEDGIINDDDRIYMGNAFPTLTGGLNFSCDYKGFDFSLFLYGVYGNKIYNGPSNILNEMKYGNYSVESYENYWRGEGTTNEYPRPTVLDRNQNNRMSQRKIEDGAYLRIQSMQLGYTFPKNIIDKIPGVETLRVYIGAQNLYTFTKYTGFDPDINNDGLYLRGEDWGSYPAPRTLNAGVKIVL